MYSNNLKYAADSMKAKGLYGLFSRPGLGKTTLMMYLIGGFAQNGGKSLVISTELSEESFIERMRRMKMDSSGVTICDKPRCGTGDIESLIRSERPDAVFIDYLQLLEGETAEVLKALKELSERYSLPIVFNSQLGTTSGDYDAFDRRPQLYDLTYLFSPETSLRQAHEAIDSVDTIVFLHRRQVVARGNGTGSRCYLGDAAKLVRLKKNAPDSPSEYCFDFSELVGGDE